MSTHVDELRCDFRWTDSHGNKLRCMFDKGHSLLDGHKNGHQRRWENYNNTLEP